MDRIIPLSDEVIGKIAAGEVVERPAAAIKELVENSIDAGATSVTIEIKDGGISYFRVMDNGGGILPGDIKMAFERHATSKIRKAEDLHTIHTLGFRGEALASISAVSKVTLTTRTKDQEHGIRAVNMGGVFEEIQDAACPEGTTIVVRDLFFNTPVRLKFLKKPSYEAGLVSDLVMRLILSHPEVSFRFLSDGKSVYHSVGDGKLDSAVFSIYGKEMLSSMRKIDGVMNELIITGQVGIGDSARGNRNHQSFFINGRYLKNALLSQALENACRERVTIGHFPTCVLHIQMPYDQVDVNVHPNKLEVRFQNERAVMESLETVIHEKLTEDKPLINIPEFAVKSNEARPIIAIKQTAQIPTPVSFQTIEPPKAVFREAVPIFASAQAVPPLPSFMPYPEDEVKQPLRPPAPETPAIPVEPEVEQQALVQTGPELQVIGVYLNTYVLAQYGDRLLMIDQHAVHERLLFNRMMAAYDLHSASQSLLVPKSLTLLPKEMNTYLENREAFEMAGFDIDLFGDNALQIRAVPVIMGEPQLDRLFSQTLDALETQRGLITLEKRRDAILQQACKHAVKGGEALPIQVIRDLVSQMIDQGVTPTCPHGRPLVIAITKNEVEKRFKRIQ